MFTDFSLFIYPERNNFMAMRNDWTPHECDSCGENSDMPFGMYKFPSKINSQDMIKKSVKHVIFELIIAALWGLNNYKRDRY